jgi:hypothetical protein
MPISFGDLDDVQFEEFCFDLLQELGFINLDWRKGTGKASSPADRGRDIEAHWEREEADGSKHFEKWFVDCKHYEQGVPPDKLQGLLTWAEAERPDYALVMASNFLSNPAKDYVRQYQENRKPPFKIRYWERPALQRLAEGRDALLSKYLVQQEGLRSVNELVEAEQEFFDKIWYGRHQMLIQDAEEEGLDISKHPGAAAAKEVEQRYGKDDLGPSDDFGWGMLNGKLSAIRWMLGEEWDFLDT